MEDSVNFLRSVTHTSFFSCLWPFTNTPGSLPSSYTCECAAPKLELGLGNLKQSLPAQKVGIEELLGRVAEFEINESLSSTIPS